MARGANGTSSRARRARALVLGAAALLIPPLLGAALTGRDPGSYLVFPPRPEPVVQPGFSLPVFIALAVLVLLLVGTLGVAIARARPRVTTTARRPVPWWGFAGLVLLGLSWLLAWTRFDWFAPWQIHTFTPLWLGYILVADAALAHRTGASPIAQHPARLAVLFATSAVFWWFFEYLNTFVGNWHYVGVDHLSDLEYAALASAAFATVLPAVTVTTRLLASMRRLDAAFRRGPRVAIAHPRLAAIATLGVGIAGLAGIGIAPQWLFPLVWLSPLLVIEPLRVLAGLPALLGPVTRGDWRPIAIPALAGLACGFLWELWNHHSEAAWAYTVPFVDVAHVFRMPLLGYAGYLPFGIECAVVTAVVLGVGPLHGAGAPCDEPPGPPEQEGVAHRRAPH